MFVKKRGFLTSFFLQLTVTGRLLPFALTLALLAEKKEERRMAGGQLRSLTAE